MRKNWLITDYRYSFSSSDFEIPGKDLGFDDSGYCRKRTLKGGRQEGVEILEISNGLLFLRVCPTRGMGIIDGFVGSNYIGWHSPVEEIVHPQYINLLEMGGRGCHYGFSEFLNRCGIAWSGAMGEDEVVDNMGNINKIFLPLHGKVGWTPASRVELFVEDGKVILEADIREQFVFGPRYLLRTRLSLGANSSSVRIIDTLFNQGDSDGEYEMIYHTNFGPPFLEEGSIFFGTYEKIMPRDKFGQKGLEKFNVYPGPSEGFVEQVFLILGRADSEGFAHNLLVNKNRDLAARVSYNISRLPYSILWKRCNGLNDGYVTGLNPCSDLPNPRKIEREEGRVGKIKAMHSVVFEQVLNFYSGKENVQLVIDFINKNRGEQKILPAYDPASFNPQ